MIILLSISGYYRRIRLKFSLILSSSAVHVEGIIWFLYDIVKSYINPELPVSNADILSMWQHEEIREFVAAVKTNRNARIADEAFDVISVSTIYAYHVGSTPLLSSTAATHVVLHEAATYLINLKRYKLMQYLFYKACWKIKIRKRARSPTMLTVDLKINALYTRVDMYSIEHYLILNNYE